MKNNYNVDFTTIVTKPKSKILTAFGESNQPFLCADDARGMTYTTKNNEIPPTPFIAPINPFNAEILASKNVLEIGCGIGRNLPFVMEKTNAHYYGVDPAEPMLKYFWDIQDKKWQSRVTLCKSFDELPIDIKMDFVIVTFVFQHIGYRPKPPSMNVTDITKEAMKHTHNNTVWFILEHQTEEVWLGRWMNECYIAPTIYFNPIGNVMPYPEFEPMTHRGNIHNIIIFKESWKKI
jgi:SAM-dependent methyltransferase